MTDSIALQSGALRCILRPDLGGCVAGLWWGTQAVLRSTPAAELQDVRLAASYPLLPYSNRIGRGRLHWGAQDFVLPPNFPPEPHSIHGVGWQRAWSVEEASATQLVLIYRHGGDAAWPFAFDSSQSLLLGDNALEWQMSITNRAKGPAPVGLGWHPYFAKSAQTRIAFAAAGRWDMDADHLPTRRLAHPGLETDCHSLDVDHCFDGWAGAVHIREGGLHIQITSDLDRLVVYTTPARDSIAVEPVSHVNNALALARHSGVAPESLGVRVLQDGETFAAHVRIQVQAEGAA